MSVQIGDSVIFGEAWGTPELRALFDERAVVTGWIEVMVALAETQAEFGLIPAGPVRELAAACATLVVDEALLREARDDFRRTNHSLLGLIRAVQRRCPGDCGEWLCYGATVQDITDTQTARLLGRVSALFARDLARIAATLGKLARRHRDTPMCGRTHGQPGLPITFGFKVAGWLDEMLRHVRRLDALAPRLLVGQLGGGVGSLSAFGPEALALQHRFLHRLGLAAPMISWTAARDRLTEWLAWLALITATAERIGHEVYNLQRPEIGELSEGFVPGTIGSITMPQKRNPEISEHLGTLARTVRHHAAHMAENLVHDHERDGRSWKGEWALLPPATLAAGKALALLADLLEHLQVDSARMRANLVATQGFIHAEAVMLALAPTLGKQSAHALVYRVAMAAAEQGGTLHAAVAAEPQIVHALGVELIEDLFDIDRHTGQCGAMVDRVLADASRVHPMVARDE